MNSKLIMVNVGHMVTEMLPFIIDSLSRMGVENTQALPTITKKGRPGFIFLIDAKEELIEAVSDFLMRELGVIGLRVLSVEKHVTFEYEMRKVQIRSPRFTDVVVISVKCIKDRNGEIASAQAEHEQIKNCLHVLNGNRAKISFRNLKAIVEAVALQAEVRKYQDLEIRPGP